MPVEPSLIAFPMHGQHKLSNEGYRTRDGHLIEWFGKKLAGDGSVRVISRPEPLLLKPVRKYSSVSVAENTDPISPFTWRVPVSRDRQRWWITSLHDYGKALPATSAPVVTWNPFLSLSDAWGTIRATGEPIVFDLLDDWTIHFAFEGIRSSVVRAYEELFRAATLVTANAEGTVELARRFGRDDVVFLPNGCDPERFDPSSRASGPMTVGYVGKIGRRLDLELIVSAARELRSVDFVFAGPILDSEYRKPLEEQANITLLGDVHYDAVPELLTTFDVGWVPHRVGEGEVGGDVIKTYEYRAAGLPVLTTPVAGATKRGLDGVTVLDASRHAAWLLEKSPLGPRIERDITPVPENVRWSAKADVILNGLGLEGRAWMGERR